MGEWNLNSMETALEFQYCSTGIPVTNAFEILVETSESLNNLSVTIPNSNISNRALLPDSTKTIWQVQLFDYSYSNQSAQTLQFTGTDLAGNLLRQMQGDTANLYYRTGGNTWHSETTGNNTSNPSLGTDIRHT